MDKLLNHTYMPAVTDVYTDLHGLQHLKNETENKVALKKVAQQFESMFINLLLKNMRSANDVFGKEGMFDSQESRFYRDMHDNQLALSLAHGRGFGVADAMYRQLLRDHGHEVEKNYFPREIIREPIISPSGSPSGSPSSKNNNQKTDISGEHDRSLVVSTPEDFIHKVRDAATKAATSLGVDRDILIAQSALETGWGKKIISKADGDSSFNLFNIKADQRWPGNVVERSTLEFLGGKFAKVSAKFRAYDSIQESFNDFGQFIFGSERYKGVLKESLAPESFISGIHKAGYATDPNYVQKVMSVYERVKSIISTERTGDEQ